jgi:predicted metal-dependent phosphoesterase TrpH
MVKKSIYSQWVLFHRQAMQELKKDYTFVDMHVHTKYSHDSKTPIDWLVKRAEQLGIGIAITDHKHAEGAIEASKQSKVLVIPGIEIASRENKEILLYFYSAKDLDEYYNKYLKNRSYSRIKPKHGITKSFVAVRSDLKMNQLIDLADRYSCLKSIPHPYTYLNRSSYMFFAKKKLRPSMRRIDAVEVVNSSNRSYMNKKAMGWAMRRDKALTAGSDAHNLSELGNSVVACKADSASEFLDAIKKKKNIIIGEEMGTREAIKSMWDSQRTKRHKDWIC